VVVADQGRVLELIGQWLGLAFTDVQPVLAGHRRTFFARVAGDPVVVKWGLDPDLPEQIPYVAGQVRQLRRRNCPVPRMLAHGPLGGHGYGWVQERMTGTPATVLDDVLLSDLMDLIGNLAVAPPGPHRNDMGWWAPAVVFGDEAGWRRTAAAMNRETASFCRRLRAWAGRASRRDYVHGDLNLSNVLVSGGRLTSVIDTEIMGVATAPSTWPGSLSNGTGWPAPGRRAWPPAPWAA
jgi:hypothetical protein